MLQAGIGVSSAPPEAGHAEIEIPASELRYLALGDSFTIGTGLSAELAYPSALVRLWASRGISCHLSNPSVNGYTTADVIAAELPWAQVRRPSVVTLLIGANDIVSGSTLDQYRAGLVEIYRVLRTAGVVPQCIVALPQPDWSLAPQAARFGRQDDVAQSIRHFNEAAREEALSAGSRYLNLFPLMRAQARRAMFAPDGLHPSATAHAEWARRLDAALLRSGQPAVQSAD